MKLSKNSFRVKFIMSDPEPGKTSDHVSKAKALNDVFEALIQNGT